MTTTELKQLGEGPYAIALNALSRIAFGCSDSRAIQMQRIAYEAFLAATEPCANCGGMESKVDACPHCGQTGRLPRSPFEKIVQNPRVDPLRFLGQR